MKPKDQNYNSATKLASTSIDLGFLQLGYGEFIHINARNGQAVEIRMDNDGNVGVCYTDNVYVSTFDEIYGVNDD